MTIDRQRFCINRKIAPNLNIERFFKLVQRSHVDKVELRNDMPSGKVTDDLSYAQVRNLAEQYGLEIVTINAVYPFNQLTPEILTRTEALLRDAQGVGAQALVLCPLNDGTRIPVEETLAAIKQLTPLFAKYNVQGLVEALGFPQSSLRSGVQVQALIRDAGSPFKLLLDSFHHYLYEKAEQEFPSNIDVANIGLVHLSGVESDSPKAQLADEDRLMLTDLDVMDNVGQVRRLERLGYKGLYSFEPFSSTLAHWSEKKIEQQINQSIETIAAVA